MRSGLKTLSGFSLTMVAIFAIYLLLTPTATLAKGRPPPPPPCDCPETIETPFGTCVLVSCGFDCVYQCPFP